MTLIWTPQVNPLASGETDYKFEKKNDFKYISLIDKKRIYGKNF